MSDVVRVPIVELYGTLIVPVQMALSDRVVRQLKDDVTARLQRTRAAGLVIDISGVDILDSYLSRAIRDLGLMARLMGVETVISGLDPMMAITLVEMGLGLGGVRTELNLERALESLRAERPAAADGDDAELAWLAGALEER
jgi:rsbT antagonist protein RsbS